MKQFFILLVGICVFAGGQSMAAEKSTSGANQAPQSLEEDQTFESMIQDQAILDAEMPAKATSKTVTQKADANTAVKVIQESEIPVLTAKTNKKTEDSQPYFRLIMSFVVLLVLGAGLAVFSRWWSKRSGAEVVNSKIRMVSQFHLSPKKSLAVVRVSGESILIGVTDNNISLIKTLSLMDEELTDDVPSDFGKTLKKATGATTSESGTSNFSNDEDADDFSLSQIKDRITNKVKGLRPLA